MHLLVVIVALVLCGAYVVCCCSICYFVIYCLLHPIILVTFKRHFSVIFAMVDIVRVWRVCHL